MSPPASEVLKSLRRRLEKLETRSDARSRVTFGIPSIDDALGGGLECGTLHEIYAEGMRDLACATGFAAAFASMAAGRRPILWVRQDFLDIEAGQLHAPGLAELGFDPSAFILVKAPDMASVLKAGREGAQCASLGACVIEPWIDDRLQNLSSSRRLLLAAQSSGVTTIILLSGRPAPSAAQTRWMVRPWASRALEAGAPGAPAFSVSLLRHRAGMAGREWQLEWDRDLRSFSERSNTRPAALPRRLVSVSSRGSLSSNDVRRHVRRAG